MSERNLNFGGLVDALRAREGRDLIYSALPTNAITEESSRIVARWSGPMGAVTMTDQFVNASPTKLVTVGAVGVAFGPVEMVFAWPDVGWARDLDGGLLTFDVRGYTFEAMG